MSEPVAGRQGPRQPIGAILAGGRGSRIGGAKATIELAGRPLISYPLAAVEEAGLEPAIVAKPDSKLPPLRCRVIHEPAHPRHPLHGIITALRYAGERPLIAIGCDMPFASAAWLSSLAATSEPLVVASVGGSLQPFPGRYEAALLPALERALADERALQSTLSTLEPRVIDEVELTRFGDPRRLCFNVNTPGDVERAERMLSSTAR